MDMTVQDGFRMTEGVAVIDLSALAGHSDAGFGGRLRAALGGALAAAFAAPGGRAVVLCASAGWPVAADVAGDYDDVPGAPGLRALAGVLAGAQVPVIALLSGQVAGGALALSQAVRLRVALTGTAFLAPETGLGLLPAAGGLVRLARRAGPGAALALCDHAEGPVGARHALGLGLCDAVLSAEAADPVVLACGLLGNGLSLGRSPEAGLADPAAGLAAVAQARARIAPGPLAEAAHRRADCAEAALLLPLDEALDYEEVAFADLAGGAVAQGLRHTAAARRRAAQVPGAVAPGPDLQPPLRVALWDQSDALALALIGAGHEVVLGASAPDRLQQAFARIAMAQETAVQSGRLDPARREADWGRLGAATEPAGLRAAGGDAPALIVAGLTGPARARAETVAGLRALCGPATVLVLEGAQAAGPVLGLRRGGALCELAASDQAAPGAVRLAHGLLALAPGAVVLGAAAGVGILARLEAALLAAAERAVIAGAAPQQADQALIALGLAQGPLARADRIGPGRLAAAIRRGGRDPGLLALALQGAGAALYLHPEGAPPVPAPRLDALLGAVRREAGVVARRLPPATLRARLWAEMAAEGAALLQEGAAHRASDIDLAAALGLGFPDHLGGPLFQADQAGLLATRKLLRALAGEGAPAPVTLWDVLIRNGKRFCDLSAP